MTTNPNLATLEHFWQLHQRASGYEARSIDAQRPIWIFGAGQFAQALAHALHVQDIPVAGFVQTHVDSAELQGLPVLDWPGLARQCPQAQLLMGIFNHRTPYSELTALAAQYGFGAPLMPWELYDQLNAALGWRFWLGQRSMLLQHMERIVQVAEMLDDAESCQTLLRLCAFRLGLDFDFSAYRSSDAHYFNRLTLPALLGHVITYVDCGAYNGDTWAELRQQPDIVCSQAFLLEPDSRNYAALVARVAQHQHDAACHPLCSPVCLPLAVADQYGILRFVGDQGESSAIGTGGNNHIAAVALDHVLPANRAHFIKFDIEGAEALALQGARNLIARSRPTLAVSLYHHPADLWELPELLQTLCDSNYRFYLRQHACNGFETVLYAIPQNMQ